MRGDSIAAHWVPSPTTVPGNTGIYQAGDGCCAWVKITGDHLLFFDIWSGEWTEITLPETHTVQRVEAAGNLVLVVCDDLAVAFNGPEQTVHSYALTGALLDTGYSRPSFGCSDELAAVLTDSEFIVFDARLDAWQVLENPQPADYVSYQGLVVEPDFAVADMNRPYPNPSANRAYSLHTGTFMVTDEGVGGIASGWVLDHGYAGIAGAYPDLAAVGYCAFSGQLTVETSVDDGLLGGSSHQRDRLDLSHLWPATRNVSVDTYESEYHMWVFDSLTGAWKHTSFSYDRRDATPYTDAQIGGQFVGNVVRDDDTAANSILYFSGRTSAFSWIYPGLFQNSVGRVMGGSVGSYQAGIDPDPPVWWCNSVQHPLGQYTTSTRDWSNSSIAGDDWFSTAQRTNGDPLMDLFFYHGPTNSMTRVETWAGTDVQVNFYSSVLNTVEQRTLPAGSFPSRFVNDHLSLVFHNGVGDYLFDARSGVVHSRGIDFNSEGLGENLVIGFDSAGNIAHGYSAVTGTWSTQGVGSAGYGFAGGDVAFFRLTDGSKYWGYSALDDSWTELVPTGSFTGQKAGGQTIIVQSSDRVWAYWAFPYITTVEEDEVAARSLAHAVDQVRCLPNPFNGRALVEFSLPFAADVKIQVFDLQGHLVDTLLDERRQPGLVTEPWQTERVASGTYLVRVAAGDQIATRKLVLVQ